MSNTFLYFRSFPEQENSTSRVTNQLLLEMSGLEQRTEVYVIAATNRLGDLASPLLSLSLSLSLSHSLFLSIFLSLSPLSPSLSPFLSFCLSFCLSLSPFLSRFLFLSLSPSLPPSLSYLSHSSLILFYLNIRCMLHGGEKSFKLFQILCS